MTNLHEMRSGFQVLLSVAICLLALGGRPIAAEEPQYTLDEIAARLNEWEAKIQSLRVQTRRVCDPNSREAVKAGLAGVPRIGYDDWIWTRAGRIRKYHWVTLSGRPGMRYLAASDPDRSWRASYTNGHDESDPREVSMSGSSDLSDSQPISLYGLWGWRGDYRTVGWLGGAIERGQLEFVSIEELDGRRCIHMRHSRPRNVFPGGDDRDFWLDPSHSFLPVKIELPPYIKYTADEFLEVEPGFFFPKRGTFIRRISDDIVLETEQWEITSVELNQPIPASLWEPPVAKVPTPDLAQKASERATDFRYRVRVYIERMLELDFWIEGGFLTILVIAFVVVLLLIIRKRRSRGAPTSP